MTDASVPAVAVAPPRFLIARELLAGGLSCSVASCALNPMDVTKIRMQVETALVTNPAKQQYATFLGTAKRIVAEEGVANLWAPGLKVAMIREMSYSGIRMGMYPAVKAVLIGDTPADQVGIIPKFAAALVTGGVGSALANPTDLVKIRQQAEAGRVVDGVLVSGLSKGKKPVYPTVFGSFTKIYKNEGGIKGLYRGAGPTIARAALLTGGQLASYDHSKHLMRSYGIMQEGVPLHIFGSLVSGVVACTFAAPADLIKTRWMADRGMYTGPIDCVVKTVRAYGVLGLFRGWVPSYVRLGPHFIVSLPLLEQLRRLFGLEYM